MSCIAGGGVRYDSWAGSSEAEKATMRLKPFLRLACEADTLYFQRGAILQRSHIHTPRTGRSAEWRIMTTSTYN